MLDNTHGSMHLTMGSAPGWTTGLFHLTGLIISLNVKFLQLPYQTIAQ